MNDRLTRPSITAAVAAALGATALSATSMIATAAGPGPGKYVAGDIHNHTTCSDGSTSMQKLVKKSMDKTEESPWGLDWFVQAGHGGSGNRNCTLVEDATLGTPAYPFVTGRGPTTTWENSGIAPKGNVSGTSPNRVMWRWQALQEYQYPLLEYLAVRSNLPLFLGVESVAAGHEHTSAAVITGQMPQSLRRRSLPRTPPYTALGSATALAQWEYCFDRNDTDTSRGNVLGSPVGNNWECSVPGSANAADPSWNATGMKLVPLAGAGVGTRGHEKTVQAVKWMATFHPDGSYYLPTHLERAGPFNPDGNNGFNVEHLRNFHNAAPNVVFGMETQPGHGASDNRGEYGVRRNTIASVPTDSVGGTTYGGTGVYGGWIGGVWDALLGEGRNFWFIASSDWHNRGSFGPDDRRSTQDFYPGEYQRNYTFVPKNPKQLDAQSIVDGLRSGNTFVSSGQVIDRLAFVACSSYPGARRTNAAVEAIAANAARSNTTVSASGCATMGEKLVVRPGGEVVVSLVVRDPEGTNYAPYTFPNPSLLQVGIDQPLNAPVLDHVDLIRGSVSGYRTPGAADYAGEWPRNTAWLTEDGVTAGLAAVPAAAKNTTAQVVRTFNGQGTSPWTALDGGFLQMTYRIPAVSASQYVRVRGTNLPAAVPWETDADGNPLADLFTNANDLTKLKIPCTTTGSNVPASGTTHSTPDIDGCPEHLPSVNGTKYVAYDVAAWADLWFYSNPIYIEVLGTTLVAGVK